MAACLGSIFAGRMGHDLDGVQNRLGVLFFMLFYLGLLSMSSLPVWRDEQALYAHERRAGAYSDGAYFCAVVLCDLLLVRMLPPLSFAVVTYRWIGLKTVGEHVLYVFAACLVSRG